MTKLLLINFDLLIGQHPDFTDHFIIIQLSKVYKAGNGENSDRKPPFTTFQYADVPLIRDDRADNP